MSVCRAVVGHYVHPRVAKLLGWDPPPEWKYGVTGYRQVTIIRHPAERMFSQFRHLERKGGSGTFEDWVCQRGGTPWGLCWCLRCHCFGGSHTTNPMVRFYASRYGGPVYLGIKAAETFLRRCDIYTMAGIPRLVSGLAAALDLDPSKYEPLGLTGEGTKVSDAQRALVARRHPQDNTKAPRGYVQWHLWADRKSRRHVQVRCPGCGRFAIWRRRKR
jgi:hypothetical protein